MYYKYRLGVLVHLKSENFGKIDIWCSHVCVRNHVKCKFDRQQFTHNHNFAIHHLCVFCVYCAVHTINARFIVSFTVDALFVYLANIFHMVRYFDRRERKNQQPELYAIFGHEIFFKKIIHPKRALRYVCVMVLFCAFSTEF